MKTTKTVIGILAHVDAGKTTLSESLLHLTGVLRERGRVDHGNTFLDNFALEKERGITIYSKQANFNYNGVDFVLLDTPGHVDFSAEMERTLQVLDYCILVISGAAGIQGHTLTLWKLLKKYNIPTFLFVNKMDQAGADRAERLAELRSRFGSECVAMDDIAKADRESFLDSLAMCDETLLEEFMETDDLKEASLAEAIYHRKVFPVFFGAALLSEGVEELLQGLSAYRYQRECPEEFGARVYKITRDGAGNRLTHLKVTGGVLRVKMMTEGLAADGREKVREKVDSIRIYGGGSFKQEDSVEAGGICAVTGLDSSYVGQGLGFERESERPVLIPILTYRMVVPDGTDMVKVLGQMRALEEEQPELHIVWRESLREIQVQVMGEVQTEILKSVIAERFGLEVTFEDGRLLYKETVADRVEGIGHFEPLRHYAEVHLIIEPGEPGSGIEISSICSEDDLDKNWQRLIFTHIEEKAHLGVLTGSPITDVRVILSDGRAHIKHTEGGDFRQATYRAIRHGLMQSRSILLEPVYGFSLEVPASQIGRAMSDIQKMNGKFDPPMTDEETAVLTGSCPVSTMKDYQREVNAYTKGMGHLSCTLKGYEPCHNTEEVMAQFGYDPEADTENTASSVFCSHGAGFVVHWTQVIDYAHLPCRLWEEGAASEEEPMGYTAVTSPAFESQTGSGRSNVISQEEIDKIFQETYRKSSKDYEPYRYSGKKAVGVYGVKPKEEKPYEYRPPERKEEYFLVDGYNVIFAWPELKALAERNIDSARDRLMDICCNFQGYIGATLILVYDAYKVKGNPGSVMQYHNIHVVYTKEAETADQYIEKTVHKIAKNHKVTVATSDALEQMIIWGAGATRLSAPGFLKAVQDAEARGREMQAAPVKLGNKIVLPE